MKGYLIGHEGTISNHFPRTSKGIDRYCICYHFRCTRADGILFRTHRRNLPVGSVRRQAADVLPDSAATILVYWQCVRQLPAIFSQSLAIRMFMILAESPLGLTKSNHNPEKEPILAPFLTIYHFPSLLHGFMESAAPANMQMLQILAFSKQH